MSLKAFLLLAICFLGAWIDFRIGIIGVLFKEYFLLLLCGDGNISCVFFYVKLIITVDRFNFDILLYKCVIKQKLHSGLIFTFEYPLVKLAKNLSSVKLSTSTVSCVFLYEVVLTMEVLQCSEITLYYTCWEMKIICRTIFGLFSQRMLPYKN